MPDRATTDARDLKGAPDWPTFEATSGPRLRQEQRIRRFTGELSSRNLQYTQLLLTHYGVDIMISPVAIRVYEPFLAPGPESNHFVQFYRDASLLCDAAAMFLESGLAAQEPVVAIARREHAQRLRERLRESGHDVGAALRAGAVAVFDAQSTLDALMVDDHPDATRFSELVGGVVRRAIAARSATRVRIFGEMVDLLCQSGRGQAALELESLWNDIAKHLPISLLCAYSIDAFAKPKGVDSYASLCATHSVVFPAESHAHTNGASPGLGALAQLQERTLELELELKQKRDGDAFRLLVESVRDYAIFMLDPRGIVTTWNEGAQRIKGYLAEEIVGRHFSCFYEPEVVATGKCDYELVVAEREGRFEDEGWRLRKDGSRFWASVIITALRAQGGRLVGFAKVTRDLTERRKLEDERVRIAQIEEANRIKDEFFATLSHELRNPLNAILGWTALVQRSNDLDYIAKGLETIQRNAQAQKNLIEDMLDMSRIVGGTMWIRPILMDMAAAVRDVLESMRPIAEAKGVTLEIERIDGPAMLAGDPDRLKQVVANLISNAVKFTDQGGRVKILLRREHTRVSLRVSDTGRGIDPAFLPHVFERFRQANSSTRRSSGLGLGLSIVRHIVELHGGHIAAESDGLNRGATFSVTLPVETLVAPVTAVSSQG